MRQRPALEYRYYVTGLGLRIIAIQLVVPRALFNKLLGDVQIPALRLVTKHVVGHQPQRRGIRVRFDLVDREIDIFNAPRLLVCHRTITRFANLVRSLFKHDAIVGLRSVRR
jgi:hypothetical protein